MKRFIVIGAGSRANTYLKYIRENEGSGVVIAVAEPQDIRRKHFQDIFQIAPELCFNSWEECLNEKVGKIGDIVIIGTLDHLHYEPTMAAIRLGYDILLEKPMATTEKECREICILAEANNIDLRVCHIMRYHPLYRKLKELVPSIGTIKMVIWLQPIGPIHFAASYNRHPYWSFKEKSGPLILTKACHDLDLLLDTFNTTEYQILSSVASKDEFIPSKQPADALNSSLCSQCPINTTCRYSAFENYGTYKRYRKYVTNKLNPTREDAIEDLINGPYDQCVYQQKGNVMEQYVSTLKIKEALVSFNMTPFHTNICSRIITFIGTDGRIELDEESQSLTIFQKDNNQHIICDANIPSDTNMTGHSGADWHFMNALMNNENLTPPAASLASHQLAFDIENSLM